MVCNEKRFTAPRSRIMGCDHTRALDLDLWCEILKRVPMIDRLRNVPLVSLCLSQACQDPALWPDLSVPTDNWTEDHWSSFLRWLVPRASGLQTLRVDNDEDEKLNEEERAAWALRVQDLMAVLAVESPQLRDLVLQYPATAQRTATTVPLAYFPLADLKHLSQLTSLTLKLHSTSMESAPLATALRAMPALEHLDIASTLCAWNECLVSIATSCSQLTCLQVGSEIIIYDDGFLELPLYAPVEIGLLTNLVELTIDNLHLHSLPDSISKLTSLQRLLIDDEVIAIELSSGLTACRQLSQLRISSDKASPVVADLKFLQCLKITECWEIQTFWPSLTALPELILAFDECLDFDHDAVLEGLVGMTGLRNLTIENAHARILPEGPYLNALEGMVLLNCRFDHDVALPSNLAAATNLLHLELRDRVAPNWHPHELFSLLESFQALKTLHLSVFEKRPIWSDALLQYKSRWSAQGRCPVEIIFT